MTDEPPTVQALEADEILANREGVEAYKNGESVILTTKAIREDDADVMRITFDHLQDLVVELRDEFR